MTEDRTSLTYWFPKLLAAGLPVPETCQVDMSNEAGREIWRVFDGQKPGHAADEFLKRLCEAGKCIGFPCFLRTSHTSAKHNWSNSCMWRDPAKALGHVANIIEYGECVSMVGLPTSQWFVREFLPIDPVAISHHWDGMPVCREFRVFVRDGKVECWHPYWPLEALEQGEVDNPEKVAELLAKGYQDEVIVLAAKAGNACGGGYWSVDVLETKRGWFITDMAEGDKSFHWKECPNATPPHPA